MLFHTASLVLKNTLVPSMPATTQVVVKTDVRRRNVL